MAAIPHKMATGALRHDNGAKGHDHAAGQVNARGQDDQCLTNGDGAHHHHLLQNQGEVLQRKKIFVLKREKGTGQYEGDGWT